MDLSVFSKLDPSSVPKDLDEDSKVTLLVQLRERSPLPDYAQLYSTWREDNWYRTEVPLALLSVFEADPAVLAFAFGRSL